MLTYRLLSKRNGFTLVEVMIVVAILMILAAAAMPSFRDWIQNTQIRAAAESVLNGMQRARAEALRRNRDVDFVLEAGTAWRVEVAGTGERIDSKSGSETAASITRAVLPAGATTLRFQNLGNVAAGGIQQVDFDSTAAGDSRELRIEVGVGGVRMCDPNVSAPADPRKCQ